MAKKPAAKPKDRVICTAVAPEHAQIIHQQLIELLRKSERYANGRFLAEDMVQEIYDQTAYLFCAIKIEDGLPKVLCAVVASPNPYPRLRMLLVRFLAGDMANLYRHNMRELILKFAREQGFDGIEWAGRQGWFRWLPGARPIGIVGEIRFGRRGEQE